MVIQIDIEEAIEVLEKDTYHNYNIGYSLGRNEILDKYINSLKSLLNQQKYSQNTYSR